MCVEPLSDAAVFVVSAFKLLDDRLKDRLRIAGSFPPLAPVRQVRVRSGQALTHRSPVYGLLEFRRHLPRDATTPVEDPNLRGDVLPV